MKYTLTPAELQKLLKKTAEEKDILLNNERMSYVFNASLGEDIESVRPDYDYEKTRNQIDKCNEKIRILKHALNKFNTTQVVGDTGLTVDQILVLIPQLTEKMHILYKLQAKLPKQRSSVGGIGSNTVIDYTYTNYSVEQAKKDYLSVIDELSKIQTELDTVNSTVTLEVDLPE